MAVTKEKTWQAAEELQAKGVNPSQGAVRDHLGGGSFAYIGPWLKEWKQSKREEHALAEVHIPESISDRLEQLQGALWNTAIAEAERRLESERGALKDAQEAAIQEVSEANEAVEILEKEQEELKAELSTSATDLQKIESELADYKERIANLREDMATGLSERTAKIESLTATVTELRSSLEKSEKRSESLESKLEKRQKDNQDEISALRKDHKTEIDKIQNERKAEIDVQLKKVADLDNQNKHLAAGNEHAQARLEATQSEIEQHRIATAKMREKLEAAQQESAELRGELKALRAEKNPEEKNG